LDGEKYLLMYQGQIINVVLQNIDSSKSCRFVEGITSAAPDEEDEDMNAYDYLWRMSQMNVSNVEDIGKLQMDLNNLCHRNG